MSKLTIFYKDADGDSFSLEINQNFELEKQITQHPFDFYDFTTKEKDTYKIMRVAKCPLATLSVTTTNEQMSELTFINENELANFFQQYNYCEYYLEIAQRVFVVKPI